MILNRIKEALEAVDPNVHYGMVGTVEDDLWDYVVFARHRLSGFDQRTGYVDRYRVAIVRENFIPTETVFQVVDAMLSIPGMRLASNEFEYDYTTKPKTNMVVELLVLEFTRPTKRQA